MQRRTFLLAGLLGSTSLAAAAQQTRVTLIYVGGWDCPPCIRWKNNEKSGWLASTQGAKVNYVEIESPKLREAYQDRYWPQELRPIRDQLEKKSGTPRFIIVKDGKVLSSEWGNGEWDRTRQKLGELLS